MNQIMPIVSDISSFCDNRKFILDMVTDLESRPPTSNLQEDDSKSMDMVYNRRPTNDGMNPSWESNNIEQQYLWIKVAWKSFLTRLCIESGFSGKLKTAMADCDLTQNYY